MSTDWVTDQPTPENLAARANWAPNPRDPATFDYLLDSDFGSIYIVPLISGTYEQLAPRARRACGGSQHSVLVEAVSDLLTTLTVPRRENAPTRCASYVAFQTSFTHSDEPAAQNEMTGSQPVGMIGSCAAS